MYLRYHAGRTFRHVGGLLLEGALIVGIAGGLVFGVAMATGNAPAGAGDTFAKGGPNARTSGSDCTASPGEVTVGDGFAFRGTNLPAAQTIYVYFDDTTSTAADPWPPTLVKTVTKGDGSAFFMMRLLHWGDFRIKVLAKNNYSSGQELAVCWVSVKN